jgi:hypothetical protein
VRWRKASAIQQPVGEAVVGLDAAVAEERPGLPGVLDLGEVALGDEDLFGVVAGLGEELAERARNNRDLPSNDRRPAAVSLRSE